MRNLVSYFVVAVLVFLVGSTKADGEKALLGRVMWSAFECEEYADISGNEQEQARLFKIGLKAGREFLKALTSGRISNEAVQAKVPIGVLQLLRGPSIDFMIGRIFARATDNAYDKIVKMDNSGSLLQNSEWILNEKLQKTKALNKYKERNCALVQ